MAYIPQDKIIKNWGFITGNNLNGVTKAVSFGVTFTAAPIVVCSSAGIRAGSDPSVIGDLNAYHDAGLNVGCHSVTTTGFTAHVGYDGLLNTNNRYGFSWIAIGTI